MTNRIAIVTGGSRPALLSGENRRINGQRIEVSGGMALQEIRE